ncbi:hypothetical protein SYJ56_16850 [Algoriphagus sp. D3-2-R+10]|uniref:hypothetical protein n=1 Tax=Algoriphagus aurantiacus TaxID=3103948 RepID=UPI002B3AF334|nr:hypothetical protein [Algoriphagus sp. D3-2-R+10]MEB2776988.1 hypothetical protein [Algoriphagus sp. D3-2-R+10]
MINKISDLEIGKEYVVLLTKDKRMGKKAVIKALVNQKFEGMSPRTEIEIDLFEGGKLKSSNILYAKEIGFGNDLNEAFSNYGKFDYEENEDFLSEPLNVEKS